VIALGWASHATGAIWLARAKPTCVLQTVDVDLMSEPAGTMDTSHAPAPEKEVRVTTALQAAAWVPDNDPTRPWSEAAELAADWVWQRSKIEGKSPLLVTNTFQNARGMGALEEIAKSGGQATPQGKKRFSHGPVLAYVPVERTLELALDLARGYSLVVVETDVFPLSEWAAAVGAVNLLDGSTSASALDADVSEALDRAIFFGGNNGWTGSHEKRHARTVLSDLAVAGRIDADAAASYAMAHDVSDKGARRLRTLIESLGR